jgi:hypothetical protein
VLAIRRVIAANNLAYLQLRTVRADAPCIDRSGDSVASELPDLLTPRRTCSARRPAAIGELEKAI